MPDGVVQWFDATAGEAAVVRGGRVFRAASKEVDEAARVPGARVHFDIERTGGVDRAVRVELRPALRSTTARHRRVGDLVGARRPDTKGSAPFARPHPERRAVTAVRPVQVARAWASAIGDGDLDEALALYAPDASVDLDGRVVAGRSAIHGALESTGLLGAAPCDLTVGDDDVVTIRFRRGGAPDREVRIGLAHGLIAAQSIGIPTAVPDVPVGATPVELVVRGNVTAEDAAAAVAGLRSVLDRVAEPVHFARLKLTHAADPARDRPELLQATVDVAGDLVRAQVAAASTTEATTLLADRLRAQLRHRAERAAAVRRPPRTVRPERARRPADEREVVARKAYEVAELTPDEAIFDMEQLDHDFYVFHDLASGRDACVSRHDDGAYLIARVGGLGSDHGQTAVDLVESPTAAPELTLAEAVERLEAGAEPFVFFADASSGRGSVVYERYDGHYGVVTTG
jgi:hypothetical protein